MNKDASLIFEAYLQNQPEKISAQYMASDGHTKSKVFTGPNAKEQLKAWIDEWVGLDGEVSELFNYIVSTDGVGRIAVKGISINDAIGRAPKPSLLPADYVQTLGKIAMKLNAPAILANPKIDIQPDYDKTGIEMILDWVTPPVKEYENKKSWRFIFRCRQDTENAKLHASLTIFYTSGFKRVGLFEYNTDKRSNIDFTPTGDREKDLAQVETIFKAGHQAIQEVTNMITKMIQ